MWQGQMRDRFLNLFINFIAYNENVNRHMWVVAPLLDSTAQKLTSFSLETEKMKL